MPEESPQREDSSPEVQRNGRALERSRSPVRPSEHRRRRSRSPVAGETKRRHSRGENEEGKHHRHHHHHHRKRHRSPDKETQVEKAETQPRDRSATPETGDRLQPVDNKPKEIPTGPRGYRSRQRYRPESNYGRLGYDVDDERDDEDRLREVERRRDEGREKEEPKVTFKGRGAMKFRESHY